jgi:hypothetical protein
MLHEYWSYIIRPLLWDTFFSSCFAVTYPVINIALYFNEKSNRINGFSNAILDFPWKSLNRINLEPYNRINHGIFS